MVSCLSLGVGVDLGPGLGATTGALDDDRLDGFVDLGSGLGATTGASLGITSWARADS